MCLSVNCCRVHGPYARNPAVWLNTVDKPSRRHCCRRVRFHVLSIGSETDVHTVHWHGMVGMHDGHTVDQVGCRSMNTRAVRLSCLGAPQPVVHPVVFTPPSYVWS